MTGRELTEWRKKKGITRKRLAELTGYTTGGLLKIEQSLDKKLSSKLLILIEAFNT